MAYSLPHGTRLLGVGALILVEVAAPARAQADFTIVVTESYLADLWRNGFDAYQANNCSVALLTLGRFGELASWTKHYSKNFLDQVSAAERWCSGTLDAAAAAISNLKGQGGEVTKITIAVQGKTDSPNRQERTIPYRLPPSSGGLKPALPRDLGQLN
ncbi:hypothetical protein GCM10011611_38910 [Aliidongia dinghuensis]|uniref:Uncharacterized protein n=1 Tax=Aliidongia dinghuensis TaxID=1867774 RepID=A0A8J2YXB3_9PROT|nr:hypothetical protein [Aliidongia dinghuensis]GGF29058.1 hypothetical protein GCM10011611_38910 [Aliidongia dinghuensis]